MTTDSNSIEIQVWELPSVLQRPSRSVGPHRIPTILHNLTLPPYEGVAVSHADSQRWLAPAQADDPDRRRTRLNQPSIRLSLPYKIRIRDDAPISLSCENSSWPQGCAPLA